MNNIFKKATKEAPVFAKINVYDTPAPYRSVDEKPYIVNMIVAVTGVVEEDWEYYVRMSILDGGERIGNSNPYRTAVKFGDYLNKCYDDFSVVSIVESNDYVNLLYHKFRKLHDNAPYKVHANRYTEVTNDSKYAKIVDDSITWYLNDAKLNDGSDVNNLDTAIKWMLENHPSYVQGMCIAQDCPSGNFYCASVPCDEYGVGNFETYDNRYKYACEWADKLGVVVGKREV